MTRTTPADRIVTQGYGGRLDGESESLGQLTITRSIQPAKGSIDAQWAVICP